jgi:hypothetical protein
MVRSEWMLFEIHHLVAVKESVQYICRSEKAMIASSQHQSESIVVSVQKIFDMIKGL